MLVLPATTALGIAFGVTTGLAVGLLGWATPRPGRTMRVLLAWLLLQGAVAGRGFYTVVGGWPPRMAGQLVPPLLLLAALLLSRRGQSYLDRLRPGRLTLLHVVRVPVELVLLGLYQHGAVPQLLTLAGRNPDILAGLSAPVVYYLVFRRRWLGPRALLGWNLVALASLLNVAAHAALSVPSPFQRLAFEQPNVAVLYFPFNWLPACVVPLVLLAHLAVIRRLWRRKPAGWPRMAAA